MAFYFHLFAIDYVKNRVFRFINIINIDSLTLSLEAKIVGQNKKKKEHNNIPVTNFKKKTLKKKN